MLTVEHKLNDKQRPDSNTGWQKLATGIHATVWHARMRREFPEGHLDRHTEDSPLNPLNDLGNWVAIKVVYDRCLPPHDIMREVAVLRRISHKNVFPPLMCYTTCTYSGNQIIKVLDFVQGRETAPYAMYMPLIPLSLVTLLSSPLFAPEALSGPYSPLSPPILSSSNDMNPFEVVSKSIIYQLLLAVAYLHSLDPPVCHRDLNPSNVLIDQFGTVKLIDFGIVWDQPNSLHPEKSATRPLVANVMTKDWRETSEDMCSQVSTG